MAVYTCPFKTENCTNNCYAKRDSRYLSVLASWFNSYLWTMRDNFVEVYTKVIKDYAVKHSNKKVVVRVHGSGDFYNKGYLYKWFEIANNLKSVRNCKLMAYTKSVSFITCKDDIPKNMVIRFSLWDDTLKSELEIAKSLGLSIYTAVEDFKTSKTKPINQCLCDSCANCFKCFSNRIKTIACEIH